MNGEVVVLGSMNLDIFVKLDELPRAGETKSGSRIYRAPGGKSSNQAVAIAKSGIRPVLIAAVGDDPDGQQLIDLAATQGIDVSHVSKLSNIPTGTAFVMVDDRAENLIVVVPGANGALDSQTVRKAVDQLESRCQALVVALEVDLDVVHDAMEEARKNSTITFLNPSPFTKDAMRLIPFADFVVANQGESESIGNALGVESSELPISLANLGVRHLIITKGAGGCLHYDLTSESPTARSFAAPSISPVDTTGCGDAFLGSLVSIYVETSDISESIKYALKAASWAALGEGAQPSYGERAQLETAFSNHSFF